MHASTEMHRQQHQQLAFRTFCPSSKPITHKLNMILRCACSEETTCRFCACTLPAWRSAFSSLPKDVPIMTTTKDKAQEIVVAEAGIRGMLQFKERLRQAHQLPASYELDVSFHCQCPETGVNIRPLSCKLARAMWCAEPLYLTPSGGSLPHAVRLCAAMLCWLDSAGGARRHICQLRCLQACR